MKIRSNSSLHVPPRPYAAFLNSDETYEKTSACGWYFCSHKVTRCYILLCSVICKASSQRFMRVSFISSYRRRMTSECIILFRKVGTSITNYTVSVPRRHQSWTLLSLLHVPISSENLLPNPSDGVYPADSVLLFLPHTHTLCLALLTRPITVGALWICNCRHAATPLSEHLRRSQPRNAADCSSLSSLTVGYKTFPNASFEALGSGH